MNCTRLDLAYSVMKLTQFAAYSSNNYMACAKHVLRYLKGTMGVSMKISGPTDEWLLKGYFDSSWVDDRDDLCSTLGYCILYGDTALLWKSKKHKSVSIATTEAEYLAACKATRESTCESIRRQCERQQPSECSIYKQQDSIH